VVTRVAVLVLGKPKQLARDATFLRNLERGTVAVGADQHDARRVVRISGSLDQRLEVAALAGNQDAHP
jgi:hypothetical protein